MVILGPIDFLFGLPINLNVNAGQKNEVDVLKNEAKIANLRPKLGQMPLLSLNINGNNSVDFDVLYLNSRRIKWCANQSCLFWFRFWCLQFGPIFAPMPHVGKIVRMAMDPRPP